MLTYFVTFLVVAVIVGGIVYLSTYDKNDDPYVWRNELDMRFAFEGYATNLHDMANMKEVCGHLMQPERLVGCTNLPPAPPDTSNLEQLKSANGLLAMWIKESSPAVNVQCDEEQKCREWLETDKDAEFVTWCDKTYHRNISCPRFGQVEVPPEVLAQEKVANDVWCEKIGQQNAGCPGYEAPKESVSSISEQ